jgi:flagellar P-ring protein precursor FlgI
VILAGTAVPARALLGIKDIADVEGIRENQLIGYGLVVGLAGTGDSLQSAPFTRQSLQAMLERLGVNTHGSELRTANVAAVMVTANLPPFATQGTRIDVNVSALGDPKPAGRHAAGARCTWRRRRVSSRRGQSPSALFSRAKPPSLSAAARSFNDQIGPARSTMFLPAPRFALRRNPDLTTARRIALTVNEMLGNYVAEPTDPGTVRLTLPPKFNGNIVDLLTDIEQLLVEPDHPAKVVVDEQSGIIVIGAEVRVSTVAVAQGHLTVSWSPRRRRSASPRPSPKAKPQPCRAPRSRSTRISAGAWRSSAPA